MLSTGCQLQGGRYAIDKVEGFVLGRGGQI